MEPANDGPTPAADTVEVRRLQPYEWYELRSTLRMTANIYLFELCKYLPNSLKNPLYRAAGVDLGEGTVLAPHVQVDPFFPDEITIGDGTVIGWGTKLLTHESYTDEWHVGPLEIGDDVTVGHSASTRPGVTIGDGATVAAHSFVNRDVEPGEKVGGVPIETL
ncbi:MAG: DapH/DapD/GlmU-related protein [Halobacteriales archaeon]